MGALLDCSNQMVWPLAVSQVIGRAPGFGLRLSTISVSSHHAELRWREGSWQLKDLGSLNGTFVNATPLKPARWQQLELGDELAFGGADANKWRVSGLEPPEPLLLPFGGEQPITFAGAVAGIPPEQPQATVWRDARGQWWLEDLEVGARLLDEHESFDIGGQRWKLCPGNSSATTALVGTPLDCEHTQLSISHSLDEEHVEISVKAGTEQHTLANRQHNYIVLLLARHRLADRHQGIPESSCGWRYLDELARDLGMERMAFNVSVFRIRQQFGSVGLLDSAAVIERRAQTRQVRVGFRQIEIRQV